MSNPEQQKWVSARIGRDRYKTEITLDSHTLIGDEPTSVGGTDLGPSPGDFLRMSLASCTAITLRMYADRKDFDVNGIEVKVFSDESDGVNFFRTVVNITGKLDEAQQNRMYQIAKKCPIHKILTSPAEIMTELNVQGS
ncbi:MAG TPA: OsmC family protein [Chryseosolibacter sp.]|nr:OsmC family protein [Chryseosolibacter sp.]